MDRRKIGVILLLALAAIPVGAQQRNATYANGALAHVPVMCVVVDRFGVSPKQFTQPAGPFLLMIRNRRGDNTEHFSLTLDAANAAEIYGFDATPRQFHGGILVDLLPGNYRLRLSNTPKLSVAITIQKN